MAKSPEGKVKDIVRKTLKKFGVWLFAPVSNGMGVHGIPDYVCCVPVVITQDMVGKRLGVFVGIETKAPGRRNQADRGLSTLQCLQRKMITEAGGCYFVVDGVEDLEDVIVNMRLQEK